MGYTIEKGKTVIWTEKRFVADPYPFNDEGDNYTFFYKNLKSREAVARCLAKFDDETKKHIVGEVLGIDMKHIALKSKHSHNKKKYATKTNKINPL